MSEICLSIRVAVRDGYAEAAAAHLRILREQTRREPGNIAYEVYRSTETPNVFFLHERYMDRAALDSHRASPYFPEHGKNGLYLWVEDRRAEYYAPLERCGATAPNLLAAPVGRWGRASLAGEGRTLCSARLRVAAKGRNSAA